MVGCSNTPTSNEPEEDRSEVVVDYNVQRTENGVTYKPEKDSPYGSFTFPIKETTYTIHALPSQDAKDLVLWEIKLTIYDSFLGIKETKYADGIIAVYDPFRGNFRVSAYDGANFVFKAKSHGWLVQTNIKK